MHVCALSVHQFHISFAVLQMCPAICTTCDQFYLLTYTHTHTHTHTDRTCYSICNRRHSAYWIDILTKFQRYQSVRKWKCKLCNLLKDFTSCVIFLSVCKPKVANILTSKLVTRITHHTAMWLKTHAKSFQDYTRTIACRYDDTGCT